MAGDRKGASLPFLNRDTLIVSAVSLALAVWGLFFQWSFTVALLKDVRGGLYTTLAAILGGLLGFVITGISILLTLGDGERVQILRESASYGWIFAIFTSTSRWLAVGTLASLLALLLDRDPRPVPTVSFLVFWIALVCIVRLARCIWVMEKLIAVVVSERNLDDKT